MPWLFYIFAAKQNVDLQMGRHNEVHAAHDQDRFRWVHCP